MNNKIMYTYLHKVYICVYNITSYCKRTDNRWPFQYAAFTENTVYLKELN